MNTPCVEFVRALGENASTPLLARHAADCPHCRLLWLADRKLQQRTLSTSPPALGAELQRLLSQRHAPARGVGTYSPTVAVLAVVTASFGVMLWWQPRADLRVTELNALLWPLATFAACLLAGLLLLTYRGRSGFGAEPRLRWAFVAGALCIAELVAWRQVQGALARSAQLPAASHCWYLGSAVALLVGAVACAAMRSTALIGAGASGALTGAIAGLAAILCVHVHCPSLDAWHLALVHPLPLVLAILVGTIAGRRWLAV